MQTRNIITDAIIYDFTTEQASRRLQSVKDSYNNRLRFDYKFGTEVKLFNDVNQVLKYQKIFLRMKLGSFYLETIS